MLGSGEVVNTFLFSFDLKETILSLTATACGFFAVVMGAYMTWLLFKGAMAWMGTAVCSGSGDGCAVHRESLFNNRDGTLNSYESAWGANAMWDAAEAGQLSVSRVRASVLSEERDVTDDDLWEYQ